jgi:hypothetical protein
MTPDHTHALIFAIEKYKVGSNLGGPARDAIELTRWLTSRGVKSENIHLFASPLDAATSDLEQLGVDLHKADHATVMDWIANAKLSGDLLLVLWGGHGLCLERKRYLLFSDAMKNLLHAIDWESLATVLEEAFNFPLQLCFIDACANHAEFDGLAPSKVATPAFRRRRTAVKQVAMFAASPGERAANPNGRGLFSTVLADALVRLTPVNAWPPDIEEIGAEIHRHFTRLRNAGEAWQTPAFYSFNDIHWDPPLSGVYQAIVAVQAATDESSWKAALQVLKNRLRAQYPGKNPDQCLKDLARETDSIIAPAIETLHGEDLQDLFTFAQLRFLRVLLSQADEYPQTRELFDQIRASVAVGEHLPWTGGYKACIYLANFPGDVPPALQYLERIAATMLRTDLGNALLQISSDAAGKKGKFAELDAYRKARAGNSARISSAALVFAVRANADQYSFESWFWPDGETPQVQSADDRSFPGANVIEAASAALRRQIDLAGPRVDRLRIEVALPRELLCHPVETWKILRGNKPSPMLIYHPVLLRWSDRLDNPRQWKQWQQAWDAVPDSALTAPPEFIRAGVDLDTLSIDLTLTPAARAIVALNFPPPDGPCPADVLDAVLNEGAPIVFWPRGDAPHEDVCDQIRERLFKQRPRDFPNVLFELRREMLKGKQPPRIALLYDDYSFIEERGLP